MMAADSDGCGVTTIVTCEGDLTDPRFQHRLDRVIDSLQDLLGRKVHVRKLEPWNSVRVTLSIPREAALRLRHLATEGSQQLRALGILSVQVEGDQVISLRLAGPEPQEIVLRTTTQQDGNASSSTSVESALSQLSGDSPLSTGTIPAPTEKIQFRSPNVICPTDTVVPKVPPSQSVASSSTVANSRTYSGPFPFTSMNQAIHNNSSSNNSNTNNNSNRDNVSLGSNYGSSSSSSPSTSSSSLTSSPTVAASTTTVPPAPPPPPPPYPGKHPPITISSPLLVNLLQNDGANNVKPCKPEPDNLQTNGTNVKLSGALPHNVIQDSITAASTLFLRKSAATANTAPVKNSVMTTAMSLLTNNSVLVSSSVSSQCNPTVSVSNSPESNNLLHLHHNNNNHNNNSSSNVAAAIPTTTNVISTTMTITTTSTVAPPRQQGSNVLLHVGIPKLTTPSQGAVSNHVVTLNRLQTSRLNNNSLPLVVTTATMAANNSSNILQLSNSSGATRTFTSYRPSLPPPPPPPPPYSSHRFEPIAQPMPQLLEITPSLTELKATDLDQLLLPPLEREPSRSPVRLLPEEPTTDANNRCNYLINPLTGELEPHVNSDNSDTEQPPSNIFVGLPSPTVTSDEDTNSNSRPDTTDQSDSESRSAHSGDSGKSTRLKNARNRTADRGRDSPNLKPTEKIKLRLKLEKSEPVSPAYKVDVSFINLSTAAAAKKAPSVVSSGGGEELRVPPLHISLRGRNHVVINNRKRIKMNNHPDDDVVVVGGGASKSNKIHKVQEHAVKLKKAPSTKDSSPMILNEHPSSALTATAQIEDGLNAPVTVDNNGKCGTTSAEQRKIKKMMKSSVHEHREQNLLTGGHLMDKDVSRFHSHFKERRGSDSELAHSTKRYTETNGIMTGGDKKRRLSHTDQIDSHLFVLGSTNTGTVAALPTQKVRKEKIKTKDSFKTTKESNRGNKSYASKNVTDKLIKQIALPTGEIDMEAKFKQRLLEDSEKGVPRPPHRTENNIHQMIDRHQKDEELLETLSDPPPVKDKPPELSKNNDNVADRKPDLTEKQANRSPNSGGQGEDSGIESMDALSEKSPNQASQSPHADITEVTTGGGGATATTMKSSSKPQVPSSMLDIEAQLAKMEGLNGEDVNENKRNGNAKMDQCCVLTSALQDSLKQGAVSITSSSRSSPAHKDQLPQVEVSLVPLKTTTVATAVAVTSNCGGEEDSEPTPVRMSPPLYTYSNPDKGRGSESPSSSASSSSDSDSNSCASSIKSKSLLEQLLIDIPDNNQNPSSPSPVTRSLRTRASSKLSSPELLNSPVPPPNKQQARAVPVPKRKRHESDSSSNSMEDARNKKPRKCSENAAELIKACMGVEHHAKSNVRKNKLMEDSSDSDEPLIEVAGKVRKNNINSARAKFKPTPYGGNIGGGTGGAASVGGTTGSSNNVTGGGVVSTKTVGPVKTRSSVRTTPALNTRSKGDKTQSNANILRRKTRSSVSEGEGKRRKDVK